MSFYVYRYVDPVNMEPIYIGKGKGDRDRYHWEQRIWDLKDKAPFIHRLRKIYDSKTEPIIEHIWESENEQECLDKEIEFIKLYGKRVDGTGTLWNIANGGQGCSLTGDVLKKRNKSIGIGNLGKKKTEATKNKISIAKKQNYINDPTLAIRCANGNRRRKHSQDEKDRRNKSLEGKRHVPTKIERLALSKHMSENNPMKNPDVIEKMRQSKIGKKASAETKQKMSNARSGMKYDVVECPHCGKFGGSSAMGRWHFDNCKFNPINENKRLMELCKQQNIEIKGI